MKNRPILPMQNNTDIEPVIGLLTITEVIQYKTSHDLYFFPSPILRIIFGKFPRIGKF